MTLRRVLALAVVGLGSAGPAYADPPLDSYCTTGLLQVCASFRIWSVGSQVGIQVFNRHFTQGLAHTITSIGVTHFGAAYNVARFNAYYGSGIVHPGTLLPTSSQNLLGWGLGASDIQIRQGNARSGGLWDGLGASTTNGNLYGIVGCGDPAGALANNHIATCVGQQPEWDTYALFTFQLGAGQTFNSGINPLQIRWHSQQVPDGLGGETSVKCFVGSTNHPCELTSLPYEVVPEPVTMTLLATGLMGVGGVGLIRRRRKERAEVA